MKAAIEILKANLALLIASEQSNRVAGNNEQADKDSQHVDEICEALVVLSGLVRGTSGSTEEDSASVGPQYTVEDILNSMKEAGGSRTATQIFHLVKDECGMGSGTFWILWNEVKNSPLVIRSTGGKRWSHV